MSHFDEGNNNPAEITAELLHSQHGRPVMNTNGDVLTIT